MKINIIILFFVSMARTNHVILNSYHKNSCNLKVEMVPATHITNWVHMISSFLNDRWSHQCHIPQMFEYSIKLFILHTKKVHLINYIHMTISLFFTFSHNVSQVPHQNSHTFVIFVFYCNRYAGKLHTYL
uniref:Uncharacterized protein n=1 Tax=Cacopsylla melanoneura TaxID=428564 RepID=A0A8D8T8D5_9HEMI